MNIKEWADAKSDWLLLSITKNENPTPVYISQNGRIVTSERQAGHPFYPYELIGYYDASVLHKDLSADLANAMLTHRRAA